MGLLKEAWIGGRKYYLAYTVRAMLEVKDLLKKEDGEEEDLLKVIEGGERKGMEGFGRFCDVASAMARAGELLRRSMRLEKGAFLQRDEIFARLRPQELEGLRQACLDAMIAGLSRELEEEEYDVGLSELEKKTP